MNTLRQILIFSVFVTIFNTCKNKNDPAPDTSCTDIDIYGLSTDIQLGQQFDKQIHTNDTLKQQYPLLDSVKYSAAYAQLQRIMTNILNSGKVVHKDDFPWKIRIIHDDKTLNAFCIPGGIIYVYTGIIKYLDAEDDLAGVMAHEISHADLRHGTKQITKATATTDLLQFLGLGSNPAVSLVRSFTALSYSRCHETQADESSVTYLSGTSYKCNGAASFFTKLLAAGTSEPPVFLSDHPGDASRVTNINKKATELNCNTTTPNPNAQYQQFKNDLP